MSVLPELERCGGAGTRLDEEQLRDLAGSVSPILFSGRNTAPIEHRPNTLTPARCSVFCLDAQCVPKIVSHFSDRDLGVLRLPDMPNPHRNPHSRELVKKQIVVASD